MGGDKLGGLFLKGGRGRRVETVVAISATVPTVSIGREVIAAVRRIWPQFRGGVVSLHAAGNPHGHVNFLRQSWVAL